MEFKNKKKTKTEDELLISIVLSVEDYMLKVVNKKADYSFLWAVKIIYFFLCYLFLNVNFRTNE